MIDNAVSQSRPSYIERWGSCAHGLIHYYSATPVKADVTQLSKSQIKIVTHGGKVFYPFAGSTEKYTVYKYGALRMSSTLYQHPLAAMHSEDEHGRDWSGYALISNTILTRISGIKTKHRDLYPVSPDDNGAAVYCGGESRLLMYGFPSGELPNGEPIGATGTALRPATHSSPDGRVQISATPPSAWYDPMGSVNVIYKYTYSGSWPNMQRYGEEVSGANDSDLYYYTSGISKKLVRDTVRPQINVCYSQALDTTFKVKEVINNNPFTADDSHRKETLTSLVSATVDNTGAISALKLIAYTEAKYTASASLTGSITTSAGDASDCATAQQPSGWVLYDGSSMSYTDTSGYVSVTQESTKLSGWGGVSEFVLDRTTTSSTVTNRYEGDGTLDGYSNDTSTNESVAMTMMFDGDPVSHGIPNPNITAGFTSSVVGAPWPMTDISGTYQLWWVHAQGTNYLAGGDVALVRVFMYRYSGDMYALAVGVAKGNINKVGNRYVFTMTSGSVKIGSVFAHGQHHAGTHTTSDVQPSLYGAANPKTGQIVRDMEYPVMYI